MSQGILAKDSASTMTTLITGGTGKMGRILARLLHAANEPLLVCSRTGKTTDPFKAVMFDWMDATTFENPFNAASPDIKRIYLIAPPAYEPLPIMKPFIDLAVAKGVKRFVLLSASQCNAGDPGPGGVHQYLIDIGVEYAVLRATGFQENFGQHPCFHQTIKESDELFTAYQDGRIAFVSSQDIAQTAFDCLTAEKSPNTDLFILGPNLYSMDDALKLLSSVVGREIKHGRHTVTEQEEFYKTKFGFPPIFAQVLASMDGLAAQGKEEWADEPQDKKFIGKVTLLEYFESNRALWIK